MPKLIPMNQTTQQVTGKLKPMGSAAFDVEGYQNDLNALNRELSSASLGGLSDKEKKSLTKRITEMQNRSKQFRLYAGSFEGQDNTEAFSYLDKVDSAYQGALDEMSGNVDRNGDGKINVLDLVRNKKTEQGMALQNEYNFNNYFIEKGSTDTADGTLYYGNNLTAEELNTNYLTSQKMALSKSGTEIEKIKKEIKDLNARRIAIERDLNLGKSKDKKQLIEIEKKIESAYSKLGQYEDTEFYYEIQTAATNADFEEIAKKGLKLIKDPLFDYATTDEKKVYGYFLKTNEKKAKKYLELITPSLTQKKVDGDWKNAKAEMELYGDYGDNIVERGMDIITGNTPEGYKKAVKNYNEAATAYNEFYGKNPKGFEKKLSYIADFAKNSVIAGIAATDDAVISAADFTFGNFCKSLGWENNVFSKANEWISSESEKYNTTAEMQANVIGGGAKIAKDVTVGIIQMLPTLYASVGTAAATTTTAIGTAGTAATSTTMASTLKNSISTMAKNPMYWNSFINTVGTDYEQAKENGATEAEATLYALFTSTLNAAVEIGGGIETLPSDLKNSVGKPNRLWKWFKSNIEESGEEVIQSFISDMTSAITYGNNPLENKTTAEYLKEKAYEGILGFAVSGFVGGVTLSVDYAVNAKTEAQYKNIGKAIKHKGEKYVNEILEYTKNATSPEIIALTEKYKSKSNDVDLGQLYAYTIRNINSAINSPTQLTVAADNFAQIFDSNNSQAIRDIASAAYVDRLLEFGIDEESVAAMLQAYDTSAAETENTYQKQNTAEESGVSYSIKKTQNIPYNEQLGKIEKAEMNGSDSLYVGVPSAELQTIGFSSAPFAMNQGDYKKSRRVSAKNKNYSSHAVPYDFFENMPQYIAQSPLLIDNGKKITIITEYAMDDTKGNGSYVIVGVLRNEKMENDTVNLIKSVYPLDDFSERITKAAEEGKLIVTNKNKVEAMLATIGIQPAEVSRIIDLAKNTISQAETDVNTENTTNPNLGEGDIFADTSVEKIQSDTVLDTFARIENKKRYTPEQQDLIDTLKALGWTLDFDNVFVKDKNGKVVTKGLKAIRANGEVNRKQKTMVIDYKTGKPKIFVIGHEFVHFLEVNPVVLQEYINNVMDTQVFKGWMNEKGYNNITDFVNAIIDERLEKNDPNFLDVKDSREDLERLAYCEIAADFTGEKVLDSYEKLQELINSMEAPKRRSFLKIMRDFFAKIAEKIAIHRGGEKGFKAELNQLNRAFQKAYAAAEKAYQKENTADDSGVKYSIAGPKSQTANRSKWFSAISKILNGADAEAVRKETGWYKGKDGKWRYYIPDNELNVDKLSFLGENETQKLGDCIRHDKLFAAYPELKNVKIRFGNIGTKKGRFIAENNEIILNNKLRANIESIKDTLIHEIQHAIQDIEGFAGGGNKNLGFAYAMNLAYEEVKNKSEFQQISIQEDKYKYILSVAEKMFDAESYEELRIKAYRSIYGEVEANQVKRNRLFDQDLLKLVQPDLSGNVVDAITEAEKFIANFKEMGYTEEEIENLFEGELNDQSGSVRNFGIGDRENKNKSLRRQKGQYFELPESRKDVSIRQNETPTRENGRGIRTDISVRRNTVGMVRGVNTSKENNLQPKTHIKETSSKDDVFFDAKYSISTDTNSDLLNQYDSGEISREEFLERLSEGKGKKTLTPKDIADLDPEVASTTPPLPRKTGEAKGDEESNTYDSVLESSIFDERFKIEVEGNEFIQKYESVTNKETLRKAAKKLDRGGQAYVLEWFKKPIEETSLIDIATGFILMDRYQRIGDYESAVAATEKVREMGTISGQQVQIFSIFGRLDPNTMALYAQKELSKAFETYKKTRTQKWINENAERFNLTEEDMEFIRRRTLQAAVLPDGRDKAIRLAEIATLIQDKLPPEKGQAMRALQRISMLLNPKTNIRNIMGNATVTPVFIASDFFGAIIDKAVSTKTKTRTTGNFNISSLKAMKTGAFETMDDFRRHVNTRNQEMNRFDVGSGKSFNENHKSKALNECAKVLNALDRFTSFCLEMGDRPFYEMWFINSLNNQMKLNKVSEATPEMIALASTEALQRTWQDSNKVVKAVSSVKNSLNLVNVNGYGLGDVLIKFTKTPANLTKAIFDFSPFGVIKAIGLDGKKLRDALQKGEYTPQLQKNFVDSLSKGITGTLLYVLAYALANVGRLSGAADDDKDTANFEKYIEGIPPYSVKIGGKWYSYDWAQPIGAVGASVADYMKAKNEKPDNEWYDNVMLGIKSGGQVLYDQSFMQSIQNLFTADGIVDGLIDSVLDEPSVFIPQLLSQTANATDDYRRVSWEYDKSFKNIWNSIAVKVPGLRQTLEKQHDVLGREIPNSQKSVFNAFFNPANTYTNTSTPITNELYDLYKRTGDNTVIPRAAPYYIKVGDKKIVFDAEKREKYLEVAGRLSYKYAKEFIESDFYKELDDAQRAEVISDLYGYANAKAKATVSDYELPSTYNNAVKYDKKGQLIVYYVYLAIDGKMSSSKRFNIQSALENKMKD